ncbi:PhzF family phenazine biosynthesis protein [Streptomyces sp. NPDC087420]|uniref:PhzF family phenazine biosynthesis protein n=1 Tax=Streptomyces sp. NPDC087420 TaxID=3365785 RepID=UPI003833BA05
MRQLRVVVSAADYDEAVAFYGEALGLPARDAFAGDGGARVVILDAGRATLEIANPAQVAMIDAVEVGRPVSPHLRLAFEVDDAEGSTRTLVAAGAELIAAPARTPWNSLNADRGTLPFALVDVFGEAALTGNPLGVVDLTAWEEPVDEEWLREVARELRQSETTFVLPGRKGAVRALRSFTAGGVEVTGAGHNALGAWWWLLENGRVERPAPGAGPLVQWIGGRELPVLVREDGALALRQAPARLGAVVQDVAGPTEAVGLAPADIGARPAPRVVDTGAAHLIVT